MNREIEIREVKTRLMNEGRCDERRKGRVEESTFLTYTGLHDYHCSEWVDEGPDRKKM